MVFDKLIQKVEAARRRLETAGHPADGSAQQDEAGREAQEEFASTLEELHVATEELRQQTDELLAARQDTEAQRQRYQELFEFAPDGYLVTDSDGVIREANRAAAAMLGLEPKFLAGKPILLFVAEEDRKSFDSRRARALTSARPGEDWEICLTPRSGAHFPAAVTVGTVLDSGGRAVGIRWMLRDISERKRAADALRQANEQLERRVEERTGELGQASAALRVEIAELARMGTALEESEQHYRSLFENMLDGFAYCKMLFDDHGRPVDFVYLEVNNAFRRLTGLENVVGKRVTDIIPGIREANPEMFEIYGRVAMTGRPETFEIDFKPLGVWLSVSVYSPEREHFVAVFDDITDRKRTEDKLWNANEKLCAILGNITDTYFCLDAKWRFVEINLVAAESLFRRPYTELLGKVFWEEYPQAIDSEFYRQCHLAVAEGQPVHFEARSDLVDGWFEVHAYPRDGRLEVYGRDITRRKRAEEERERLLRELEAEKTRWQATVENMLDPVATCDASGRLTYKNPAYARMLGSQTEGTPDENYRLCRSDGTTFDPLDLPLRRAALRGEEVRNVVVMQRAPGGEERIGIWNAAPLYDAGGRITGGVAVGRDITAQCQAEAQRETLLDQVAEERDRLQALVQSIADEIWVCDIHGNVSLLNAPAAEGVGPDRTGTPPPTLSAIDPGVEICTPDGRPRGEEAAPLFKSLHGETLVGMEEIVRHLRTGELRHRLVSSAPIRSREGRIVGAVAVAHDITYRKRAEEVLKRYQVLAERARDIVVFIRLDGQILEANQAAVAAYGYPREELLRLNIRDIRAPETRAITAEQMAQADTEGILFETMHRRKDGTQFPVEVSSRAATIGGERVLLSIVRDITERKQSEAALREGEDRLQMALHAASAGSWEWNLLTGKVRWGDQHHALFGAAIGAFEPSYEAWMRALHPDDRPMTEGLIRRAMNLKQNLDIEYRIIRPDGDVRWLNTRGHSIYDEAGLPVRMLGITLDVTQRKLAEVSLLRARETLEHQLTDRTAELTGTSRRLKVELSRHEQTEEEIGRLGQTLERRASELVALDRVGRALASSLDPEAVLWLLVSEVRSLLGTDGAAVLRHDSRSDELVFVASEGGGLGKLMGERVPTTGSIVGWVFHERQAALLDDVRNDPRFYSGLFGEAEIPVRSLAAVPLISRGNVIGVLGTINKIDGVFAEHDLQLLAAIANSAAVAIENARLFAAEQGRRQQLEAVRAVTSEVTRELDLAKVLEIVVRRATELLGVGVGTVFLWDEGERVLVPRARLHPGEDRIAGRNLRPGEGIAGVVAERRQGVVVNEYRTWPHAIPPLVELGTVTAAMGEPLMYGDQFLGVLVVNNEGTARTFSQEDEQLLALLASHAAIAIANARLFEEVQTARQRVENLSRRLVEIQEAERRHIARELHDEIGQSLTGLKLLLDMSARSSPEQAQRNQSDVQVLVNDLLSQVRTLSLELRPAMLDDLGLLPALVWYFERYRARTNVQVIFKHTGVEGCRYPTEVETAAYRIVQEALTNVARYAGVEEVTVRLWADDRTLGVQVEDKGTGFDPEVALASHMSSGLAGMRERSGLLGGRMMIESTPGTGTCVAAEFPIGSANPET